MTFFKIVKISCQCILLQYFIALRKEIKHITTVFTKFKI